ncbi:MAG: alpha/beta hydrolase [Betaproteobacteria bacterium]
MKKPTHLHLADLRGIQRLANAATVGITDLVEAMHHTVLRTPGVLGKSPKGRTGGITGLVYRSVRGVTRFVGGSIDALLGALAPLIAEQRSSPERQAVLAALNGVLGDYLAATGNPLAISMRFRTCGVPLEISRTALAAAFPEPGQKLLVLMHGLCMNDLQWARERHDHGAALARDLGYTPVYLHYNSGLHISTNGREFADLMETLVREWPHPIERLSILGHSMGGLVARSACHYAALAGHGWTKRLDDLVFLGTPHFGAPLERAGKRVDFVIGISPWTAPFARLGKVRSAGITDLGHANLRDDDWQVTGAARSRAAHDPMPLPAGVRCYAMAASRQERPRTHGAKVRGDELVPVNSALGCHRDAACDLGLPETHRWTAYGTGHIDLLGRKQAYARIRRWLADDPAPD